MFGWQLGFWLAFYFHFMIRDHIISHVDAIALTPRLAENRRRRYIIIATVVFAIGLIILIVTYLISRTFNDYHTAAWSRMIKTKCPTKYAGNSRFYAD